MKTVLDNYKAAINILKTAQNQQDPELQSPQVRIEPMESLIDTAVRKIKEKEPNYFVGIRKIVSGPESHYGHVESGPGKDPAIIHINFQRIKSEVEKELAGADRKQIEEEIVKHIVDTISHEAGHSKSFKPEEGFVGGESPAEKEEQRMRSLMGR